MRPYLAAACLPVSEGTRVVTPEAVIDLLLAHGVEDLLLLGLAPKDPVETEGVFQLPGVVRVFLVFGMPRQLNTLRVSARDPKPFLEFFGVLYVGWRACAHEYLDIGVGRQPLRVVGHDFVLSSHDFGRQPVSRL